MSESYEKAQERISNQRASSLMDADKTIKQLQSSLAAKDARIAELEEALSIVGTNCADVKYWKLANRTLANKSYCPKCGKSWDLHEMGVPAPYCPEVTE